MWLSSSARNGYFKSQKSSPPPQNMENMTVYMRNHYKTRKTNYQDQKVDATSKPVLDPVNAHR